MDDQTTDDLMSWLAVAAPAPDEYKAFGSTRDARRAMQRAVLLEEIYIEFVEAARWRPETKKALNALDRSRCRVVQARTHYKNVDVFVIEASNIDLLRRATLWFSQRGPESAEVQQVYQRTVERLQGSLYALRPGEVVTHDK